MKGDLWMIAIALFTLLIGFTIWFSPPMTHYRKRKWSSKAIKTTLITLMIVNTLLLTGIYIVTTPPDVVSGNGNTALFLIFPFAIFFSLLCYMTATEWYRRFHFPLRNVLMLSFSVIVIALVLHIYHVMYVLDALGGTPSAADSKIYRIGWWNQYTNTFFINIYTVTIIYTLVILISTVYKKLSIQYEENGSQ